MILCECKTWNTSFKGNKDHTLRLHFVSFLSAGEDPCWAQPSLCMLPPPLSMATLGEACMQNKEVIKKISMPHILSFLGMDYWLDISSAKLLKIPDIMLFVCLNNTGRRWIKQMFIGAFMIPAMVCGTAFFINFIAIYYHASRAIPFGTMVCLTQRQPP